MTLEIRMDPRLSRRLAEKHAALERQRPLPSAILVKLSDDLRARLTYHSNAIEGNTLDLGETQLVIAHGITIGGHTLKEHGEATNHAAAYSFVLDLAQHTGALDEAAMLRLHALITKDLVEVPGAYRIGAVFIAGSEHRPPPHRQVPELMANWFAWLEGDGLAYPPLIRAALAHEMLLAIHPCTTGADRPPSDGGGSRFVASGATVSRSDDPMRHTSATEQSGSAMGVDPISESPLHWVRSANCWDDGTDRAWFGAPRPPADRDG